MSQGERPKGKSSISAAKEKRFSCSLGRSSFALVTGPLIHTLTGGRRSRKSNRSEAVPPAGRLMSESSILAACREVHVTEARRLNRVKPNLTTENDMKRIKSR